MEAAPEVHRSLGEDMVIEAERTEAELELRSINTIRVLAAEAVQRANSGHPGLPMGAASMAYTLWLQHLRFSPKNPSWPNRDRFVLSAGHGSMLLYALLHLTGFELSVEDLRHFRQWQSRTPGHPEAGETPGVEITTGPLGQGFGSAVGMAIAEARLAAEFNREGISLVDHRTYVLASDGDLMEGVQAEAASLAGHLGLGKLIVLYDDNGITIDGSTDLAFSEDVPGRFAAYGWHVQSVADGDDVQALDLALAVARETTQQPSLISVATHIGYGSPNKQDTAAAHGEPLGESELKLTKERLGWASANGFDIPADVSAHFRAAVARGEVWEREWCLLLASYSDKYPEIAKEWQRRISGALPEDWDLELPEFAPDEGKLATRAASGKVLNVLASRFPELIGGSADLSPSNKTVITADDDFRRADYGCRNLRFGVREHGMGAMLNGIALHKGLIPYGGTFLVFSDYMRPAMRLAALTRLPVIYVFTHDSIALGEDGPTHQPIEHLASLRAMPNILVIRPADANEVREAWCVAIAHRDGPVALVLSRQGLPILDREQLASAVGLRRGGYVLCDAAEGATPQLLLLASGSEISIVLEAWRRLTADGLAVRVVNLACWELFEAQDSTYRDSVLPPGVRRRLAVEAGATLGWSRFVGDQGAVLGIDRFGASAPGGRNMKEFGFTADEIVTHARNLLAAASLPSEGG